MLRADRKGMRIAGLYLAAGRSSRMGVRKQDAPWTGGLRLGGAALVALRSCGLEAVCAVVRPDDPLLWLPGGGRPEAGVNDVGLSPLAVVPCDEAEKGMSFSIRCGLQAIGCTGNAPPDGVLIALADQPFVDAEWLSRLIRVFGGQRGLDYAASGKGEVVMPPVLMSWPMSLAAMGRLEGDRGAGSLLLSGEFAGRVLAEGANGFRLFDVDTPVDLEEARKRLNNVI